MTTTQDSSVPPAAGKSRWWRSLLWLLGLLLVLLVAGGWLLGREASLQFLARQLNSPSLQLEGVSGSLYGPLQVRSMRLRDAQQDIHIQQVKLDWLPAQLWRGRLHIPLLQAAQVDYTVLAPSTKPIHLPTSLKLPLALDVDVLELPSLRYQDGKTVVLLQHLKLALRHDAKRWELSKASLTSPWGQLEAAAQVANQQPFVLAGKLALQQEGRKLALDLGGSLQQMEIDLQASSQQAAQGRGRLRASLQPFAAQPLRQVKVEASEFDPAAWLATWPKAALSLHANLELDAQQRLQAKLHLQNQRSASFDQQGLPVQEVSFALAGNWPNLQKLPALQVRDVKVVFAAGGEMLGDASWQASQLLLNLRLQDINLQGLHTRLLPGKLAGEVQITQQGLAHTRMQARLQQGELRLDVLAALQKQQLELQQASLSARGSKLNLQGKLDLAGRRNFTAQGQIQHFNPAQWGSFPQADLNAALALEGSLAQQWQVLANLTLGESRLWQQALRGHARLRADTGRVQEMALNLALGVNQVKAEGRLGSAQDVLRWQVAVPRPDLLHSVLPWPIQGELQAQGEIRGSLQTARTSLNLQAKQLGIGKFASASPSLLAVNGELALHAPYALSLQGRSEALNPASFAALPSASLHTNFALQGQIGKDVLAGPWQFQLQTLPASRWQQSALQAQLGLEVVAAKLKSSNLKIQIGDNHLQAQGALGGLQDRWQWQVQAGNLAQIDPTLAGKAQLGGVVSGSLAHGWTGLQAEVQLQASALKVAGLASVQGLQAKLQWPGHGAGSLALQASAQELLAGKLQLALLQADLQGSLAAHQLVLSARNEVLDARLSLHGGLQQMRNWRGQLTQAQNQGRYPFQLQQAANFSMNWDAGLTHLRFQRANFKLAGASLEIENLEKQAGRWLSRGKVQALPLAYLLPDASDELRSDLLLGGSWQLDVGEVVNAQLQVVRESGDLRLVGGGQQSPGLQTLFARLDIRQNALQLEAGLETARAGHVRLQARSQLQRRDGRWGLAGSAPLALQADARLSSLAWFAPLLAIPDLDLEGQLALSVKGSGSVDNPQLQGEMNGEQLGMRWPGLGLKLRNGQLRANLQQDQLLLHSLRLEGQTGHAQASGWLRFAEQSLRMQIAVSAERLQLLSRPDRRLQVSGSGKLLMDQKQLRAEGKFRADTAYIELAAQNGPSFSEDVVIRGAVVKPPKASALPLVLDLEFDLGENFTLRGSGVQAELLGSLRLQSLDRRGPRANGSIAVRSGSYTAYGQKLAIERGVLNFSGALDNPGINLLAVRKPLDAENGVQAGIELRGTLQAPQARLVSTPVVPDGEKLMWLILGHGSEGGGDKDNQLLGLAASALFGGDSSKFASVLALDEINLSRAKGLENAVLSVGKRLSSKAFVTLEQGASSATTLLKLRYTFNPRLSLQVQTGSNNALDAFYTWRFD